MNMIPQSNGLYKVKRDRKVAKKGYIKIILMILVSLLVSGFIFQSLHDFIGNEKISSSLYYTKVDGKKIEYNYSGSGDYTIVFAGAIGTNLYQWNSIAQELQQELGVKTFVYNRSGYGFSESNEMKTPKDQAEDLKILLRKAGVSGNIILVGEEYGSLIMSNFAALYPESVQGVVLVNPYNELEIKSEEYKKSIKNKYYKSYIQYLGSYIGLTSLLDKFNLSYEIKSFVENLSDVQREEYDIKKNQKNYRQAILNEFESLYKYEDTSQNEGLLEDKHLYLITKNDNEPLTLMGNSKYTTLYKTESEEENISTTDGKAIIDGIKVVVRESKKINKSKSLD